MSGPFYSDSELLMHKDTIKSAQFLEQTLSPSFNALFQTYNDAASKRNVLLAFSCDLELSPESRVSSSTLKDARLIEGFSRMLDILKQNDIFCTFFTQGKLCETYPEIVEKAYKSGNEIGAHGFSHCPLGLVWRLKSFERFNSWSFVESEIQKTKDVIHQVIGAYPVSFRAPYLRTSKKMLYLLEKAGFLLDSSLYNPDINRSSLPYHPSIDDISKDGGMDIFEVPITVSVTPKRKCFYYRYPSIMELNEEELQREIIRYIQRNQEIRNHDVVFVPMVHPYEFCSQEFCKKALLFIKAMKTIKSINIKFSDFAKRYK